MSDTTTYEELIAQYPVPALIVRLFGEKKDDAAFSMIESYWAEHQDEPLQLFADLAEYLKGVLSLKDVAKLGNAIPKPKLSCSVIYNTWQEWRRIHSCPEPGKGRIMVPLDLNDICCIMAAMSYPSPLKDLEKHDPDALQTFKEVKDRLAKIYYDNEPAELKIARLALEKEVTRLKKELDKKIEHVQLAPPSKQRKPGKKAKPAFRPLSVIAAEIAKDWKSVYFGAQPYLDAMLTMNKITDKYFLDPGHEIVARFLCNASRWKGEVARRIKKELNDMLKESS